MKYTAYFLTPRKHVIYASYYCHWSIDGINYITFYQGGLVSDELLRMETSTVDFVLNASTEFLFLTYDSHMHVIDRNVGPVLKTMA